MQPIIPDNYNVYQNKDGRYRVYDKITKKVSSFPRLLYEIITEKQIPPGYDIHNKDGNFENNLISNLEVIQHKEHCKIHAPPKYYDKEMTCPNCGKTFIWTAEQQRTSAREDSRAKKKSKNKQGPFCSRHCAGQYTYVPHNKPNADEKRIDE